MIIYASRQDKELSIDDFVGKDLWVKLREVDYWHRLYVRILRANGIYYYVNKVYAVEIEEANEFPAYSIDALNTLLYEPIRLRKSCLRLMYPIEVLTTDEVIELLTSGEGE